MQETATNPNNLIPAPSVREMVGGITEVTLWRWLNQPEYAALNFPKPVKIATRNYWRVGDIESWIADQMDKAS